MFLFACFAIIQTLKYQSKSHSANEHRHEKLHNTSDQTPPSKMLRRSDSPDSKRGDGDGRTPHAHRPKDGSKSQTTGGRGRNPPRPTPSSLVRAAPESSSHHAGPPVNLTHSCAVKTRHAQPDRRPHSETQQPGGSESSVKLPLKVSGNVRV